MDETQKWTLYLIFLVAGFATGIGSIGLFPQFWLHYGLMGLLVHLGFLVVFTLVAIFETERVMKSGYYFIELYRKVLRRPAMILAIAVTIITFLSYYTANVMLILLGPYVGTGTVGRLIAKIIMLALIFVIITRAKEKTFAIMSIGSLFFIGVTILTAILFKVKIPPTAAFLATAKHMVYSWQPLSLSMVRAAAERALYSVGLGFGFYIMLGSFMNERFNAKTIIGTGILIQVIVSLLATLTVVYAIAPSSPERLLLYAYGGEEQAIKLVGELPDLLSGYSYLLILIALSMFFAGLTSILPTAEVGVQVISSMLRVSRTTAATYLIAASLILGIPDSVPSIADMILRAVSITIFFTAIFELYPVVSSRVLKLLNSKLSTLELGVVVIATTFFVIEGLHSMYSAAKHSHLYILSPVVALIIILFGLVGDKMLVTEAPQ
ncbi:sodium-dependent transporter [Thermococcus stetteri]|uniref:sodium-dependent transporter n=1 Tax=Thermococcus stetteri TaxID=49900 RepID=UPI001AE8E81C|nr:sodium-dependent transporter [Thermococcus stetteri]MBP1912007.1 SNF family Na+-dependent transporter [Thermococcus stetteri]